jgi:hypothetical protein
MSDRPCARCSRRPPAGFSLVAFGLNTGEVTLVCATCAGLWENQRRGRILPDHPTWRLAPELARRAELYLHELDRGQPSGRRPEALRRLREAVGMALPQPNGSRRWRRVARGKPEEAAPAPTS